MEKIADIAVVGAGIAGLAHAYIALKKGKRVVLFERDAVATGASIRNFGLVWPIGQEPGVGLTRAMKAREHWLDVSKEAGFWLATNGSMHLAYHEDELAVLEEFMELYGRENFDCKILSPEEVLEKSPAVRKEGLLGGLWSATEGTVYSREAIRRIPLWLVEKYGLIYKTGHVVTGVELPVIHTSRGKWQAERIYICSGADFETLYPEVFDQYPVTKCKLQMLKAVPDKPFSLGPSLCAGLTLRHYAAFSSCKSLPLVDERYNLAEVGYRDHGVHVLLAQNPYGELIIGDSHHYNSYVEPFNLEFVDDLILNYLNTFLDAGKLTITERWNGVYPKYKGNISLVVEPEPGVVIVNGLGGAGMTLSFGIAEENLASI